MAGFWLVLMVGSAQGPLIHWRGNPYFFICSTTFPRRARGLDGLDVDRLGAPELVTKKATKSGGRLS